MQEATPEQSFAQALACHQAGRLAEPDGAIDADRRAAALRADLSLIHSNLLLTLHYRAAFSAADLAREHQAWAERHVTPLASDRPPHANDRESERRLRVGYVSPDFRDHAILRFILPLLEQHDAEQVQVHAYSDVVVVRPDEVTARIRTHVEQWRDISALTDARKPAPVQLTYLAYCSTTGVDAIDYRFTDRSLDPPDSDADHYVEQSVHLPDCYWCYSAPAHSAAPLPASARGDGPPTFGSLNNFAKVTDDTLRVWAGLRQKLRARLERSPVMDARRFALAIESAYRAMWHDWCRSR